MLNILKNTINRVFASGVDSDASAFITATGLSGTTQKSAITTLVKDLKASGLWSKMKAVYPMVTDNYNLLSYTEDFSNAAWGKVSLSVSANTTTAPNGTNTADTITDVVANQAHSTYQSGNPIATGSMIGSVYLKDNGRRYAVVSLATGASAQIRYSAVVDLQNGTITQNNSLNSPTNTSSSITNIGNGWYRISVKLDCTIVASNANYIIVATSNTGTPTVFGSVTLDPQYVGDGSSIFIWGAQLESASTASTYQPISTTPSAFMASQMKYNLKDARDLDAAFRLTWSGGWTYSATGATPNGTNAYADSKLNLLTNLPGYDSSFSVYYRQDLYGTYKIGALGATFNEGMSAHLGWTNTSGTLYNDHLGRNTIINNVYGTFNAYHISTVTSTASQKLFRNGVLKVSGAATSGITMPSLNFYFGAANQNGTANYFDPKQIAFGTLSTGLTDSDAMLLNQIVEKYQVALSRGVQAAQSFYYNSAYSNEANTYLYSTQITGTTQVSAINTLINGLKANNLWSKMKAVYPFVTDKTLQSDMAAQMKFNLVNPQDSDAAFRLAFSGGWTYSTNGAQPNGTNGYADTKFIPSSNLTINDQSYSIYSRSNTAAGSKRELGVNNIGEVSVIVRYTGDLFYPLIGNINYPSVSNTDSRGYYISNRTDGTNIKGYKNGNLVLNSAQTPSLVTTYGVYLGARNNAGAPDQYTDRQFAFATIGNGLTDAEAALLYQLIQQYQTDLSRQV